MAASRGDLAASEESNAALRRANADLTESRAALRESQERLRLILDSAADYAIFSMDTERRIASWNAGAERLLGWSEEEILGQPADAIFTPEDRGAGAPEQEAEGALRDGRAADERWHLRKDGTRFWANGLMLPLRDPEADPESPPLGLLKVMRDETKRRRAEERLFALLQIGDRLRKPGDTAGIAGAARSSPSTTWRGTRARRGPGPTPTSPRGSTPSSTCRWWRRAGSPRSSTCRTWRPGAGPRRRSPSCAASPSASAVRRSGRGPRRGGTR